MRNTGPVIGRAGWLIIFFLLMVYPAAASSSQLIYTIQTGSFIAESDAQEQFDSVTQQLTPEALEYLRIEKIGRYYSVRLGRYDTRALAESALQKVESRLSAAIVVDAYIKKERTVKIYQNVFPSARKEVPAKPLPKSVPSSPLIYTIQTGSFTSVETARKEFDSMVQKFSAEDLEYLRIEKIGKYYSLRVGRFEDRASSEKVYGKIKPEISTAVIMSAYMKDKRIVQLYTDSSAEDKQLSRDESVPDMQAETAEPHAAQEEVQEVKQDTRHDKRDALSSNQPAAPVQPPGMNNGRRKIKPNNERMGDMYAKKGRYLMAIEEYQEAGYKRPILRKKLAALLYDMGFVSEAVSEMEEVVELSPNTDSYRMQLGMLYLAKNEIAKAREQFVAALEINPGFTNAYCYLGELFYREKDYSNAWMAVKMAQRLGYSGQGLIKKLRMVSKEPAVNPWDKSGNDVYVRLILVNSYEKAGDIVKRISEGELFEEIAGNESMGPGRMNGGFVGRVRPSEIDAEIVEALRDREIFENPVIVAARAGFHIVQRIAPFTVNDWASLLADSGSLELVSADTSGKEKH